MKIFCYLLFIWLAFISEAFASSNYLANPSFEEWEQESLVAWKKSANANFSVYVSSESSNIKTGTKSAILSLNNVSLNSYRYLSQKVPIKPSLGYKLSGYVKGTHGDFEFKLRLAWYAENSNNQFSTVESISLNESKEYFTLLQVQGVAPSNAAFAESRLVVIPKNKLGEINLIVDDLNLEETLVSNIPEEVSTASTSNQTPPKIEPRIIWKLKKEVFRDVDFDVFVDLINLRPNKQYYIKIRGGRGEALSEMRTKKDNTYLADTDSWVKFPLIQTDENGNYKGIVTGYLPKDKVFGDYFLVIRVRDKESESNLDSLKETITFQMEPQLEQVTAQEKNEIVSAKNNNEGSESKSVSINSKIDVATVAGASSESSFFVLQSFSTSDSPRLQSKMSHTQQNLGFLDKYARGILFFSMSFIILGVGALLYNKRTLWYLRLKALWRRSP